MTHLSDDLIGALDEDLHGPPVVVGHPIQKPLKETQQRDVEFGTQTADKNRLWYGGGAQTSQAAWLLLNCLVSSSIHCSMVGWRGGGHTLASPHRKHFRLKAPKCQFYLLLGVDESLEDERGAELQRRRKKKKQQRLKSAANKFV